MKEYRLYYIEAGSLIKIGRFSMKVLPNPPKNGGYDNPREAVEAANIISEATNKEVMVQRYLDKYTTVTYCMIQPKQVTTE